MAEHMRPLGLVQSPKPDGITGTFLTVIQPASGPPLKEREKTYGEPTDEAKLRCNLGIAYDIRKLSNKRVATGFNRILRMLNRKQIPVCEICHRQIHRGAYDSLKLSELAYLPR